MCFSYLQNTIYRWIHRIYAIFITLLASQRGDIFGYIYEISAILDLFTTQIRYSDTSGFERVQQHALFPRYHITIYIHSVLYVHLVQCAVFIYVCFICMIQCSCANAIELLVLHTPRELRVQLTNSG